MGVKIKKKIIKIIGVIELWDYNKVIEYILFDILN